MEILVAFCETPIPPQAHPAFHTAKQGALLEFHGTVRDTEAGKPISAIRYELYPAMAESEIRRLLREESEGMECAGASVIHRFGIVPAGEAAVYIALSSPHRQEGLQLLTRFLNRFKQDVPIWKTEVLPC